MALHNTIKVSSANVQGIRDKTKRFDVLNYLLKDTNILCLQDTHLIKADTRSLMQDFPEYEILIEGVKTNSRGVCIFLKKNFEYKIKNTIGDNVGNIILIDLQLGEISLRLINVYAPNTDNPIFFKRLAKYIDQSKETYTVLCGDLNLVLDSNMDSKNYVNLNNQKAREVLLDTMHQYHMSDIFRQMYPNTKRYTWRRKNPMKQARLDYVIGSNCILDLVHSCKILPGYRSDHSKIEFELLLNSFNRGKGTWRFNCSLLRNMEYTKLLKEWIDNVKEEYAVPIYLPEGVKNIKNEDLQLTISDSMFLEMLLLKIRGNTIQFASKLKKSKNERERLLIKEIEKLENLNEIDNQDLISYKKEELETLRESKLHGQMIRSRVQHIQLNEKPTNFFCNLEKSKYIDKTIKKITTRDGVIVTDQNCILNHVREFYAKLFENKDMQNANDIIIKNHISSKNKLTHEESASLNGPITINELNHVLKNMKNNKTPGIDGFPVEFLKFFWNELKIFIQRSLNESYTKGILPQTLRQTIITCLPKGNKPRDELKNWRPISLTSVLYKMVTSVIAQRIKTVLPKLISHSQTGFIKGRFIGENTRLVYDLMNYTERKKLNGLIMLIDFEKAFDSISWNFMYKVLDYYNFSKEVIKWIKLFNTDITATIQQVGVLSNFFPIQRGCKQGDPIAPYLFIICSQVLCEMIHNSKDIRGIIIGSEEYKISQFADDTTIFMDGSEGSLQHTLNVIEVFGTLSGLKINLSKTKIVWIGKKKMSKEKLVCGRNLNWDSKQFELLGITFDVDLHNIPKINYKIALLKVDKMISLWQKRKLTPMGKITVIKSLLLSQLNHLFMSIPLPDTNFCTVLSKKLYNFLWDDKPEKIKRSILSQNKINGGLKMPNIELFIMSLKSSWMNRLLLSTQRPWITLFESSHCTTSKLIQFGPKWGLEISKKSYNVFWKEIFQVWNHIYHLCELKTGTDIVTSPLWFNSKLENSNLCKIKWHKSGISVIGDIINSNFDLLTQEEIERKYNFRTNFLEYLQIKSLCKKYIKNHKDLTENEVSISRPYIPHHLAVLNNKQGCKGIYNLINRQVPECKYQYKWNDDLGLNIDKKTWKNVFMVLFNTIQDNHLIWFLYRIIHRILGTNKMLYKMSIHQSEKCRICDLEQENLMHLFVECGTVANLWNSIEDWILRSTRKQIKFSATDIILGYLIFENNNIPINTIIAVTKYCIFTSAVKETTPTILQVKIKLKITYNEQQGLNNENGTGEHYYSLWQPFINLLS